MDYSIIGLGILVGPLLGAFLFWFLFIYEDGGIAKILYWFFFLTEETPKILQKPWRRVYQRMKGLVQKSIFSKVDGIPTRHMTEKQAVRQMTKDAEVAARAIRNLDSPPSKGWADEIVD